MSNVATRIENSGVPEILSAGPESIMAVISRAATDPTVNVDKLDRLLGMYERIKHHSAEEAFNLSMTAAQTEMRPIAADANNPQTKSRYASYLALDRAMRPIYTKHGFSLSFNTGDGAPDGFVRVICDVAKGGYSKPYHVDMPADGKGAKGGDVMTKTHAVGSAVTYGQRYLIKMIFNITVGDDDDGNRASVIDFITPRQADQIIELLEASGKDRARFLRWAKVSRIEDIPADLFQSCIEGIKVKVAK